MGDRTSYPHGTFSWVELATSDQNAAKRFYADLFGWEYQDNPVGDEVFYSMAKLGDAFVAAIAPQHQEERQMGIPPHWNSYVTVDDVDAVSARVAALGGTLEMAPFDVMDVGRMAVVVDPEGAVFFLWEARSHIGAGVVNVPGALCWNELATRDPKGAEEFYSALLGWEFELSSESAGPQYWMIGHGDGWNGGMRLLGDETPGEVPPHWLVYFAVADVERAAEKASAEGAEILVPRMDVGERGAFAALADPQGAVLGLFEGRLDA